MSDAQAASASDLQQGERQATWFASTQNHGDDDEAVIDGAPAISPSALQAVVAQFVGPDGKWSFDSGDEAGGVAIDAHDDSVDASVLDESFGAWFAEASDEQPSTAQLAAPLVNGVSAPADVAALQALEAAVKLDTEPCVAPSAQGRAGQRSASVAPEPSTAANGMASTDDAASPAASASHADSGDVFGALEALVQQAPPPAPAQSAASTSGARSSTTGHRDARRDRTGTAAASDRAAAPSQRPTLHQHVKRTERQQRHQMAAACESGATGSLRKLPQLEEPEDVLPHRIGGEAQHMPQMLKSSKFRDRFPLFEAQLRAWGYYDPSMVNSHRYKLQDKNAFNAFGRLNPDLLYALSVRELQIFVKKFKLFPARHFADRKVRAARSRLLNLYVDGRLEPGRNGAAMFQDVLRLILYISQQEEFGPLEKAAPGIVRAASDLLPMMLSIATQPPSSNASARHCEEWTALMDDMAAKQSEAKARKRARNAPRCATLLCISCVPYVWCMCCMQHASCIYCVRCMCQVLSADDWVPCALPTMVCELEYDAARTSYGALVTPCSAPVQAARIAVHEVRASFREPRGQAGSAAALRRTQHSPTSPMDTLGRLA